jgi:hypothetical protein
MEMIEGWTGGSACALQAALRLSNEAFAARLRIGVRTVGDWHQKPGSRPRPEMQQLLDAALAQAPPGARQRFAALMGEAGGIPALPSDSHGAGPRDSTAVAEAELRLVSDLLRSSLAG